MQTCKESESSSSNRLNRIEMIPFDGPWSTGEILYWCTNIQAVNGSNQSNETECTWRKSVSCLTGNGSK